MFPLDATIRCFLPSVPSLPACTHTETHLLTQPCLWRHNLKFLCSSAPKHWPETSSALKELLLASFFFFFLLIITNNIWKSEAQN